MEGHPVAVSTAFTIPAQPPVGTLAYIPLGGDGFTSPFAAYSLQGFTSVSDASGGSNILAVTMDDRFCSLLSYAVAQNVQASAADAGLRLSWTGGGMPEQVLSQVVASVIADVSAASIALKWDPTPAILPGGPNPGVLNFRMDNVTTDSLSLNALIYLFNIRVRETTPMGPLLWARGST